MLLLLITAIFGPRRLPNSVATLLLLLEIITLNAVIALNGAASNPFSMVLLVPLVLGLMWLPLGWSIVVLAGSIAGQLSQLYLPQLHTHNASLAEHGQSMIIGFVLTCGLISAVVAYFRWQLNRQTVALHTLRERQLRDEQLLAIGTAAAQLTHDAASPVQTIRLLLEEIHHPSPHPVLTEIEEQFRRLETMLHDWRTIADDVRQARLNQYYASDVFKALRHTLALARPESAINWPAAQVPATSVVIADRTLLPALTSIVLNACEANDEVCEDPVNISLAITPAYWQLEIENQSSQVAEGQLQLLGNRLVNSQTGSGAGAVLSNATIEKFGGQVRWYYRSGAVITTITLPAKIPA